MRAPAYIMALFMLAGCESASPDPVKPATVRVSGSDFCPIMRGVAPPTGRLSWSPTDSVKTIESVRAVNAAVTKRCSRPE